MKLIPILFTVSMVLFLFACGDDDSAPTCDTDNITYTNTVEQLFSGCAQTGCHVSGATIGSGSLANYDDAKAFVAKGRTIGALKREDGFGEMPKDPATGDAAAKMDDCNIDKIEAWIAAGTPE